MASAASRLREKEKEKMNPSNVTENPAEQEQEDNSALAENTYKVSRTVKDANGERKAEATYHLPVAKTLEEMNSYAGGLNEEILYWFNFGRKVAARQQVFMALNNQFPDEKINDLNKAFVEARDQMLLGSKDPVKIKRYTDFILGEDQYAPLVAAMKERDENKNNLPHFDFSIESIKKPGDKPGPKAKTNQ